jgi:ketosteroid isomerase-like protein
VSVDPDLQRLLDESAIRAVVHRYARGVDRRDFELVRSCYHPDAREDRGPGRYQGDVDGYIEWLRAAVEGYASTSHHIATQTIELDGDAAWVESYCLALHRTPPRDGKPAVDRLIPCRYFDRFERRDGEWRIASRQNVYDPGREDPVVFDLPPLGTAGVAGPDDPTYRRP